MPLLSLPRSARMILFIILDRESPKMIRIILKTDGTALVIQTLHRQTHRPHHRPLPPATPKSQTATAKTAAKSLIVTTIESFDHTAFLASDNALDPANATKRLRAERLSQFGTGRMATTLSNDQKLAAKHEPDLNDWPVTGSIATYDLLAFTGASGSKPCTDRYTDQRTFKNPLPYFRLFFDDDVIALLIQHTNIVGCIKYDDWVDCDHRTMMAVLGTMIRFGKFPVSALPTSWNREHGWIQSEQSGPEIDLNVCGGQCTLNPVNARHRKQRTGYGTYRLCSIC
jgi:hypothetical protein